MEITYVYKGKRLSSKNKILHKYGVLHDGKLTDDNIAFSKKRHSFGSIGTIFKIPSDDGQAFSMASDTVGQYDDEQYIGEWIARDKAAWLEKQNQTKFNKVPQNDYDEGIKLLRSCMFGMNRTQRDLLKMRIFLDLK